MNTQAIRQEFVRTITTPWAEPLPVFDTHRDTAHQRDSWQTAGDTAAWAGNALVTAGLRLAAPAILGFAVAKHAYEHDPRWLPAIAVPAAAGAATGVVVGAAGIACNLASGALFALSSALYTAEAGMAQLKLPVPA